MPLIPASADCVFPFDANMNDVLSHVSVSNYGAALSSAQKKFGTNSLYFNGTPSSGNRFEITMALNNLHTIAFWFYRVSAATSNWYPAAFSTYYTGRDVYAIVSNSASDTPLYGINYSMSGGATITRNEWHHMAVTQNGTTFKYYLDGALVATKTASVPVGVSRLCLGALITPGVDAGTYFNGYIDDLIVTNDEYWTANFTPPATAWGDSGYDLKRAFHDKQNEILFGGI